MYKAILILAHKNGQQIQRLIDKMVSKDTVIFLHLDSKWKNWEEELSVEILNKVVLVKNRVDTALFSWSLVQGEIELLKEAKEYESKNGILFSYYLLMSGQDYPIKSIEYINQYLDLVYPKPLIDMTPYHPATYVAHKFKSFRFYRINSFLDTRFASNRTLRRLLKVPVRGSEWIATKIVGSPYEKITNYILAAGSQWWILPDKIVNYALNQLEENNQGIRYFRHVNTPDEAFFQTMAANSILKDMIEWNDPFERQQNCMTYAFFTDNYGVDGKGSEKYPFTGHPYLFKEEDFEWAIKLPHFFVRKVDIAVSEKFMNKVDEYLEKNHSKVNIVKGFIYNN